MKARAGDRVGEVGDRLGPGAAAAVEAAVVAGAGLEGVVAEIEPRDRPGPLRPAFDRQHLEEADALGLPEEGADEVARGQVLAGAGIDRRLGLVAAEQAAARQRQSERQTRRPRVPSRSAPVGQPSCKHRDQLASLTAPAPDRRATVRPCQTAPVSSSPEARNQPET